MKTFYGAIILTVFSWFNIAASVLAADINGLWTKTTSADLNNITTFYSENRKVRAIGYSSLPDKKKAGMPLVKSTDLASSYPIIIVKVQPRPDGNWTEK